MATATMDSSVSTIDHHNPIHSEFLPLIDLRCLSQSELLSISLCSSSASLRHLKNDTDVCTPKVDRSVFNESAGSRKQTFSRLRLAPRSNLQLSSSNSAVILRRSTDQVLDEENSQIVSVLKSLFSIDSQSNPSGDNNDNSLVSVPVQNDNNQGSVPVWDTEYLSLQCTTPEETQNIPGVHDYRGGNIINQAIPAAIVDSTTRKRKRGRPRKNESFNSDFSNNNNHTVVSENKETENNSYRVFASEDTKIESKAVELHQNIVEENKAREETVNVSNNGIMVDPYREELMRRTSGMHTEAELLQFLQGLEGEWVSWRKKRKIVDANVLGGMLPRDWKLMLCIRKQAGHVWLGCRRYISPSGHQLVSCKEVSSYLLSLPGCQDSRHSSFGHIDGIDQFTNKITPENGAGSVLKDEKDGNDFVCHSALFITSKPVQHDKQSTGGSPDECQTWKRYKCHKCTMVFDESDGLLQHLVSFHPRRLRHGTSNEDVVIKNGKYECQFCHKPFEGKHRYSSHLGNHIKEYLKRVEASNRLSLPRRQDSRHSGFGHIDGIDQFTSKITPENGAGSMLKDEKDGNDFVCHSALFVTSKSVQHDKQATGGGPEEGQTWKRYKCHKCTMVFDEADGLLQHLISFHQRNPKRLRHGTSNEEVIIKNGKYECQFCHKPFEEKQRYNSHLGNHIKDYLKRVESSNGAMTIQKSTTKLTLVGVCPNASKFQELTRIGNAAITSIIKTSDDISSAVPCCSIKGNTSFEAYCGKQDVLCSITKDKVEKMTEVPVVAATEINVCSGAEVGLSNKENPSFCRSSHETGYEKCTMSGVNPVAEQEKDSENCLLSAADCDEVCSNHMNYVPTNLIMVEQNQERSLGSCLLAPNGKEETCTKENMKDGLLSSTIEAIGINGAPFVGKGEQISGSYNNCTVLEEVGYNVKEQLKSKGCLFFPPSKDQKHNFKSNESKYDEMDKYGNKELRNGSVCNDLPVKDSVADQQGETYRSCSGMPFWNEQLSLVKNDVDGVPICTMKKPCQEKESEDIHITSYGSDRSFGFKNNIVKISDGTLNVPQNDYGAKNSSDIGSVGRSETNNWLERSSKCFLLVPSLNEQTLGFKESCYAQTYDDNNVNRFSCITEDKKYYEAKSPFDGWINMGFAHFQPEQGAGVVSSNVHGSCSSNQRPFAAQDNITGLFSTTVDEEKQKSSSVESPLCPHSNKQVHRAESSLNGTFTGTTEEEPILKGLASTKTSNLALGIDRHNQPNAIPEFTWRTEGENNVLSGFANASSRLVSSASCFPAYNLMSDKGDNGLFSGKVDGVSSFKGPRSGIMENVAYNFLDSHSNEAKNFLYDVEMAQGFDLPIWLEKESLSLFPKVASKHHLHPIVCVSCLNELNHETLESDGQTASMGLICAVCKAKLCGN